MHMYTVGPSGSKPIQSFRYIFMQRAQELSCALVIVPILEISNLLVA